MTPQQIEAIKLALEALESCSAGDYSTGHVIHPSFDVDAVNKAIDAIDEALAQPEQEPMAWADLNALSEQINSVNCGTVYRLPSKEENRQPLYTTPSQRTWVGLTGLDQKELMAMSARDAVFATEAKLKERNT